MGYFFWLPEISLKSTSTKDFFWSCEFGECCVMSNAYVIDECNSSHSIIGYVTLEEHP